MTELIARVKCFTFQLSHRPDGLRARKFWFCLLIDLLTMQRLFSIAALPQSCQISDRVRCTLKRLKVSYAS
jgi:hypothetical protein